MTRVLVPHLHTGLRHAREVVMHPDLHTDGAVLEACEYLETWGDWMDAERARALRRAVVRNSAPRVRLRVQPIVAWTLVLSVCAVVALALLIRWFS